MPEQFFPEEYRADSLRTLMEEVTETVSDMKNIFPELNIPDIKEFAGEIDRISHDVGMRSATGTFTPESVDPLIEQVYTQWGIVFDPEQDDLLSQLPHTVVSRKKGSCLGVSLLFLLIAEKLGCPLYGVILPGHFFVRYDDGVSCRNIEPNRDGYNHPLAYYKKRYATDTNPWYTLKNLSGRETAAVLFYNVANICSQKKNYKAARRYYQKCLSVMSDFAEAWGNYAVVLSQERENEAARAAFDKAYTLFPRLAKLAVNKGAFEIGLQEHANALATYKKGLSLFPDDRELRYGLAFAYFALGKADSAEINLTILATHGDTSCRTSQLTELVKKERNFP